MKRILSILLAFALLVGGAFSLTACNDEPDSTPSPDQTPTDKPTETEGTDYTVTVLDHEGNPIEGLTLKFAYEGKTSETLTTGADGKATAKLATEREVKVEFVDLKGYGAPSSKKATFETMETELTITLNPNITVIVVNEDGAPVAGVSVQICHNVCLMPEDTNAEGKIVKAFAPKDKLKVSIAAVPDGYAKPEIWQTIAGIDYHAYFEDGSFTLTVVIPYAE